MSDLESEEQKRLSQTRDGENAPNDNEFANLRCLIEAALSAESPPAAEEKASQLPTKRLNVPFVPAESAGRKAAHFKGHPPGAVVVDLSSSPEKGDEMPKKNPDAPREGDKDSGLPYILRSMLADTDYRDAIAWSADGLSFAVLRHERLVKEILPRYFHNCSKFSNFQRMLYRYGFRVITVDTGGQRENAYQHEYFRRDKPHLLRLMTIKTESDYDELNRGTLLEDELTSRQNEEEKKEESITSNLVSTPAELQEVSKVALKRKISSSFSPRTRIVSAVRMDTREVGEKMAAKRMKSSVPSSATRIQSASFDSRGLSATGQPHQEIAPSHQARVKNTRQDNASLRHLPTEKSRQEIDANVHRVPTEKKTGQNGSASQVPTGQPPQIATARNMQNRERHEKVVVRHSPPGKRQESVAATHELIARRSEERAAMTRLLTHRQQNKVVMHASPASQPREAAAVHHSSAIVPENAATRHFPTRQPFEHAAVTAIRRQSEEMPRQVINEADNKHILSTLERSRNIAELRRIQAAQARDALRQGISGSNAGRLVPSGAVSRARDGSLADVLAATLNQHGRMQHAGAIASLRQASESFTAAPHVREAYSHLLAANLNQRGIVQPSRIVPSLNDVSALNPVNGVQRELHRAVERLQYESALNAAARTVPGGSGLLPNVGGAAFEPRNNPLLALSLGIHNNNTRVGNVPLDPSLAGLFLNRGNF